MQNLVIGNTSQLAKYFPDSYVKISSRNIDVQFLKSQTWDNVHICFAEQRTFLVDDKTVSDQFYDINFTLVKDVVTHIKANRIFYYSTADLWNDCNGAISVDTPFQFKPNNYTMSKYNITVELKNKFKYPNVSIVYPFNFNSIYRKNGYLFSKIFNSIIDRTKITIGDTHYYRDIIHPEMVVDCVMKHNQIGIDFIVGSGRLVYVNDLIIDLYQNMNMDYKQYVVEDIKTQSHYRTRLFYSSTHTPIYDTQHLINKTISELKGMIP